MEHFNCKGIYILNGSQSCEPSGLLINKVVNFFKVNNYVFCNDIASCNTVLLNTCCVTNSKCSEAHVLLEKALGVVNVERIIMFGCYAKIADASCLPKKVICIAPKEIEKLEQYFEYNISINDVDANLLEGDLFVPYQNKITNNDFYIMICQGCTNNCSYCNIKKAKGNTLSKSQQVIVEEVEKGLDNDHKEFVLLADDCASYGDDIGTNIVQLIENIFGIDESIKVKLATLYPASLIKYRHQFIELFKTNRISYINAPIQSASNEILSSMNRNYDIEIIKEIINEIKTVSDSTWIYTHIMINFPGETRKHFLKNVSISKYFDEMMYISYSDNPGTIAASLSNKINKTVQQQRIDYIRKLMNKGLPCNMVDKMDEPYA